MRGTISIGRVLGVRIRLNWSMVVVFALIATGLADTLSRTVPGVNRAGGWALGLGATVLFYVSLVAHELAHAVVARRLGVTVEGITVWLFGGMAQLRSEALDPRGEALIAFAGPATTFALALVFGVVAAVLQAAGAPAGMVTVGAWLSGINVILGIFNLVPAVPLDGGRGLHAWLWHRRRDRVAATVSAARSGRAFGYGLMSLGLLDFWFGDVVGGIWLAFLGWFLLSVAGAEERMTVRRGSLEGIAVGDVMSEPVVVPGWMTISAVAHDYVTPHRQGAYPVRDFEGAITGLVTLAGMGSVPRERRPAVRVSDVALPLPRLVRARPDEALADLLERMSAGRSGGALIYDGERLVGLISPSDVQRAIELVSLRSPGPAEPGAAG